MSPTNLARLLGFLFIVVATFLSTVYIPILNRDISQIEAKVSKFELDRQMEIHVVSNLKEDFTRRRIELFEANMSGRMGDKRTQNELLFRSIRQTARLAEGYSGIFAGDKMESLEKKTKNEIKEIVDDKKMTLRQKLDAVENVWKQEVQNANTRLQDEQDKHDADKKNLKSQKEKRERWFSWFGLLQILGLVFFSGAEIIDKLKK